MKLPMTMKSVIIMQFPDPEARVIFEISRQKIEYLKFGFRNADDMFNASRILEI